jgi:hypothetical protein
MIFVTNNITKIEGDAKQLMTELTVLLSSFKETLKKEFNLDNEQCNAILAKSCEIAFMTNEARKILLDELCEEYYD